jgi:hypothetical protein
MTVTKEEIEEVVTSFEDHETLRKKLRGMMGADDRDPYRPALQFFVGLLAFSLALLVALIGALPKSLSSGDTGYAAVLQALGGTLAWTAILAFVAAACALVVQWLKLSRQRAMDQGKEAPERGALVRILLLVGLAVGLGDLYYGVVGGWAVMTQPGAAALPTLREAVCGLTQLFCT